MECQESYWAEVKGMSGNKKRKWLSENQQHVVDYWQEYGTQATLLAFRLSHTKTLEKVLKRAGVKLEPDWRYYQGVKAARMVRQPKQYGYSADLVTLETPANLTGTAKHKWLQLHKADIVHFFEAHGLTATSHRYEMQPKHLFTFLEEAYRSIGLPMPELKEDVEILRDAVILQKAAITDLRAEVKELADAFQNFECKITEGLQQVVGSFLQRLAVPQATQTPSLPAPQQPQLPAAKAPSPAGRRRHRNQKRQSCPKPYQALDVIEQAKAIAAHSWVDEEEEFYRLGLESLQDYWHTEQEALEYWGKDGIIARGQYEREHKRLSAMVSQALEEGDWRTAFLAYLSRNSIPYPKPNAEGFKDEWGEWKAWEKQALG